MGALPLRAPELDRFGARGFYRATLIRLSI